MLTGRDEDVTWWEDFQAALKDGLAVKYVGLMPTSLARPRPIHATIY